MSKKRSWQEPVVRSIDQLIPAYGACTVGPSPVAGGSDQCVTGGGATVSGNCTTGNGAKQGCNVGNGVKV
jgi:hypothetical protein